MLNSIVPVAPQSDPSNIPVASVLSLSTLHLNQDNLDAIRRNRIRLVHDISPNDTLRFCSLNSTYLKYMSPMKYVFSKPYVLLKMRIYGLGASIGPVAAIWWVHCSFKSISGSRAITYISTTSVTVASGPRTLAYLPLFSSLFLFLSKLDL